MASYTPPSLGGGSTATQYSYDGDGRISQMARPDGVTVTYGYDTAGRLHTTTLPQGTLTRTFSTTTGQLVSLVAPSTESMTYSYDEVLRTGVTWSWQVACTLKLAFDRTFRISSKSVNDAANAYG